jgi:hypothetical protein
MPDNPDSGPIDAIAELAHAIINECPSCVGRASEITTWAGQIRERRPSRQELEALVDATCRGYLPDDQRTLLIDGLRALVRFAKTRTHTWPEIRGARLCAWRDVLPFNRMIGRWSTIRENEALKTDRGSA